MKLHFPWKDFEKLLEEINSAQTAQPMYGEKVGKGFLLVGDQGIYMMPNTTDGVHHAKLQGNEKRLVVYAKECNPDTMEFDDWWENKRRIYGGDDGSDFILLADVMELVAAAGGKVQSLVVELTPDELRVSFA